MRLRALRSWALACLAVLAGALPAATLLNGDFESGGTAWSNVSNNIAPTFPSAGLVTPGLIFDSNYTLDQVHSGAYAVNLFSGRSGVLNAGGYAAISQTFTLPAGPVSVEFYLAGVLPQVHAADPGTDGFFEVSLFNSGGSTVYGQRFHVYELAGLLVDDGIPGLMHLPWTRMTVDLSPWAGSTVTLRFLSQECSFGVHSMDFYVDDVRLLQPGSPTLSPTPTATRTVSPTRSPTPTITLTRTASPTRTATVTPSISPTFTDSPTPTESASVTPTFSYSPTPTESASATPTFTASPTPTESASPTPTFSASPTASITPTATETFTATPTPTASPTASPSPTVTPTFTISPTPSPTPPDLYLTPKPPNPNPADGDGIWLPYVLSADAWVEIQVYDIAGEKVRTLEPIFQAAGAHERFWDLRNSSGNGVASGIFLYHIKAKDGRGQEDDAWMKCAVAR